MQNCFKQLKLISQLKSAFGLREKTLFGIVNAGISGITSHKKTRNKPVKYTFNSFDKLIIKEEIKKFYTEKNDRF
jgi:hypothetical protein